MKKDTGQHGQHKYLPSTHLFMFLQGQQLDTLNISTKTFKMIFHTITKISGSCL